MFPSKKEDYYKKTSEVYGPFNLAWRPMTIIINIIIIIIIILQRRQKGEGVPGGQVTPAPTSKMEGGTDLPSKAQDYSLAYDNLK